MRKDPPYDIAFHYATELLSLSKSLVINSPQALRDFNEKLIILPFLEYIPDTMVTASELQIKDFLKGHSDGFILKSLASYQGRSVEWITKDDEDSKKLLKAYTKNFTTPVMIQEYIPDVQIGDKRILVLGGKIIGAVLREPLKNNYLANLGQGGIARKTTITDLEKEIVNSVSEFLLKNGLHFVGFDVIGEYLTEINITCPTGIVHINKLNNIILEKQVVDYFLNLVKN
jgi:glutathione synthase